MEEIAEHSHEREGNDEFGTAANESTSPCRRSGACGDKNAANPPMVEYFFGEADPLLERMRTALRKGNAAEMGNAAHRLKGTACYLGAPDAMDATQRVEQAGKSGNLPAQPR